MDSLKTDVEKPPQKKLKQSTLPFQSQSKIKPPEINKKRKLSNTVPIEDEPMIKCVKIILDRIDSNYERTNNEIDVESKDHTSENNDDVDMNDSFSSNDEEDKDVDELDTTDINKNDSEDEANISDVSSLTPKPLTPKQIKKRLEKQKRHEERELLRQEKEKAREAKKLEKLKQKQERDEQKKKERDEKEKKRQAEIELKNEEKRLREEDRRKKEEQKEEERKRKELEKEEQENKKKKAAEAFVNYFFVPKNKVNDKTLDESQLENEMNNSFMPFAVKNDMQMAPIFREKLSGSQKQYLDEAMKTPVETDLYLTELKSGKITGSSKKTWSDIPKNDDDDDDVVVIEDNEFGGDLLETAPELNRMKIKLLQFCDNRRPPYWGTWTKKSDFIKSRRPFGTDKKIFDYEVDSDDEWEEEEPGESLEVSDDEKEPEDDYEVDNEFFVPHGYLSDEEGRDEEDDSDTPPPEQIDNHEHKLKLLEEEFLAERKSKTDVLKPRVIGCIWSDKDNKKSDETSDVIWRFLSYRKILCDEQVVLQDKDPDEFTLSPSSGGNDSAKKKLKNIPEKYLSDFVSLIHGNQNGKEFLYKEFKAYLLNREPDLNVSKNNFNNKLKEIATYTICTDDGPLKNRHCWYVNKEIQEALKCDISLPNKWSYILTPKKQAKDINTPANESENNSPHNRSEKKIPPSNITKFTHILSEEEKCKQFESVNKTEDANDKPKSKKRVLFTTISTKNDDCSAKDLSSSNEKPAKKRVALVSLPKEPPVSKPSLRVNLLTQFIQRTTNKFSEETQNPQEDERLDPIVIDLTENPETKETNNIIEESTKLSTSQDRKILKEISENDSKLINE